MNDYFENKFTYNDVTFQLTDTLTPDEREIHTYHEILYFIDGEAELLCENSRLALRPHSLLTIPKETYHFIRLYKPRFLRLKISIPKHLESHIPLSDVMKGLRVVAPPSDGVAFVLQRLLRIMQEKGSEKNAFYAYAALLMLIEEIDARADAGESGLAERSGLTERIVRYVSENLAGDLSVSTLASAVNASPSGIIHSFKNELGISLHNYVTQRRLIHARELILGGHKPSKIYPDCGYAEYSSFYRAYVKLFGYSPAKEKRKRD